MILVEQNTKPINRLVGIKYQQKGRAVDGCDCVGLCALYLEKIKGIKCIIPDDIEENKNNLEAAKKYFLKFPYEELEPDDVAVFFDGRHVHAGIFLGYDQFLEINSRFGKSRIVKLNFDWKHAFVGGVHTKGKKEIILPGTAEDIFTTFFAVVDLGFASFGINLAMVLGFAAVSYSVYSAVVSAQQARKLRKKSATTSSRYKEITNTYSNDGIVPLIYGGPLLIGGNIIWQSDPGPTVKRFLVYGEGECQAIEDVELNEETIDSVHTDCSYDNYLGTATQVVDSRAASIVHGMKNLTYSALTIVANDGLSGNVTAGAKLSGRKIKTYSGSTWLGSTFSRNPIAILRDYLILSRKRGGAGLSEDDLDASSFGSTYDYCEGLVDDGADGTEARYRFDYIFDEERSVAENIVEILSTCNGYIFPSGSGYKIVLEKADETAAFAFDEDNILENSFSWSYGASEESPNKIGIKWIEPLERYNPDRVAWAEDELDQDTRDIIEDVIEMYGIIRQSQALRRAKQVLYETKINPISCSFEAFIDAICVEPGDIVTVTHSHPGWTEAMFRVMSFEEADEGKIKINCKAYNSSILDDTPGASIDGWDYGSPYNPFTSLDNVDSVTLSEDGWRNNDGVHISSVTVFWAALENSIDQLAWYQLEISKDGGDYTFLTSVHRTKTSFVITHNLEIESSYTIKVKTLNKEGILSTGTASDALVLIGKDSLPSDVLAFLVKQYRDKLSCVWTPVADVDVRRYEIRKGASWISGDVVGADLAGAQADLNDIRTGSDQAYWIKAIDNSGNYSENATEATLTVDNIPFQNIVDDNDEHTAWGGTKSDTEKSGDNLTLSAGKLTGTYTTPQYDIGYVCTARLAILRVATTTSSLAWDDDASAAFDDSKTLRFTGYEAPSALTFEVRTSEDNVTWTDWEDWILADHICRYYQVRMTVTRENLGSNILVSQLTVQADIPDVDDKGTGEVTVAADGDEITFTKTFHEAPAVNITITSGVGYAHKFSVIPSTTGFTVKLYELDGTLATGTFGWHAHGK